MSIDEIDRGIIYLLQDNARSHTTSSIADKVGVSSSTVANRISKLESNDVITGYQPTVDYGKAGLDHHLLVHGTVPFEDRDDIADRVLEVAGVVNVRELLSSEGNVLIEAAGESREDVEATLESIHEAGVVIERTDLVKRERSKPFDEFGKQFTTDS